MSENSSMRPRVIRALTPLDAKPIENLVGIGTPDVNHALGWIELKWLRHWPKRDSTIVRMKHYKKEQKVWATRRINRGGLVHLLLQAENDWLLFDGKIAALWLGKLTREELFDVAEHSWRGDFNEKELLQCIMASAERKRHEG